MWAIFLSILFCSRAPSSFSPPFAVCILFICFPKFLTFLTLSFWFGYLRSQCWWFSMVLRELTNQTLCILVATMIVCAYEMTKFFHTHWKAKALCGLRAKSFFFDSSVFIIIFCMNGISWKMRASRMTLNACHGSAIISEFCSYRTSIRTRRHCRRCTELIWTLCVCACGWKQELEWIVLRKWKPHNKRGENEKREEKISKEK